MANRFEWKGMTADGSSVTLKRYDGNCPCPTYADAKWIQENASSIGIGVVLDLETTGLNQTTDKIIEIALRKFRFDRRNGEVISVSPPYAALQDPGVPLNPRIQSITGLTDSELKGKNINWNLVESEIADADLIIAHNAGFDRPFVERYCPPAMRKVWACSFSQIDWQGKGYSSTKLELLSIHHGFFVDAHRALSDIDALLYLVSMKDNTSGSSYLFEIVKNAFRPSVLVIARHSAYETKDLLRERGYSWNVAIKSWQKQVYRDTVELETQWLETTVYKGKFRGEVRDIPLTETFRLTSL